jgi:hypothetical protein
MIVRELLIAIGFKVDKEAINETNKALEKFKRDSDNAGKSAGGLGRKLKDALVGVGITAAIAAMGKATIATISEFQRLKAQLQTIEGDEAKAEVAFQRLQAFASSTPFQLKNVVEAFARLRAVGLEPTNEDLTAIGDTAAGMGRDIMDFTEAVVGATTGEMERLKQFGILATTTGDKITFSYKGQKKTIKKESKEIYGYLMELGKANFAGGMERQAATIGGAFSNLQDNAAKFMNEIGDAGLGKELVILIKELTNVAGSGQSAAFVIGRALATSVKMITGLLKFAKENAKGLGISLAIIGAAVMVTSIGNAVVAIKSLNAALLVTKLQSFKAAAGMALIGLQALLVVGMFVLLALVIDDLFGFLMGKESVLGDFLDPGTTPEDFIKDLKNMRTELLLLLGVGILLAAVFFGPIVLGVALVAAIIGSAIVIFDELKSNWTLLTNYFKEKADDISKALVTMFGPLGLVPALLVQLWAKWDEVTGNMSSAWTSFKDLVMSGLDDLIGLLDKAGNLFDSGVNIGARIMGGGAESPAVDLARRSNEVKNNRSQTNINAQIPITLNPPPGADTDSILEDMARKIEGVMAGVFDSSASNFDGAVD